MRWPGGPFVAAAACKLSARLASTRLLRRPILAAIVAIVAADVMECCDSLVELLARRPLLAGGGGPNVSPLSEPPVAPTEVDVLKAPKAPPPVLDRRSGEWGE